MEKIYLVGTTGPEHYNVIGIFKTKKEARKCWDKIRLKLIEQNREMLDKVDAWDDMYERIIENLQEEDPKEIDNYPHSTPFISERSVLDNFDPEGLKKGLKERADDPEKRKEIERKIRKCSKITSEHGLEQMDI